MKMETDRKSHGTKESRIKNKEMEAKRVSIERTF